mgnify:CR=1 FL=1
MINNLYIIDNAGCLLFSHCFIQRNNTNEQLISGFLSAMSSFAQETFQTGLQTMGIRNGQKLVFFIAPEFKLLITAIADAHDNNYLLEKLLGDIANLFIREMRSVLSDSKINARIDLYQPFEKILIQIVKNKDKKRNIKTLLSGLFVGLFLLVLSSILTDKLLIWMNERMVESTVLTIFLIVFCGAVSLCSFVSGFLAGSTKIGMFNGLLFWIILNLVIALNWELFLSFLLIDSYVFVACIAAGYAGGKYCDRKYLYPLS